jgi:hypothetical protein
VVRVLHARSVARRLVAASLPARISFPLAAGGLRADDGIFMSSDQLTLIQGGEFIVCEDIAYTSASPSLTATAALPINTMKTAAVRLDGEIIPLPFIRSQDRKAVSHKIRIDGAIASRIAQSLGLP